MNSLNGSPLAGLGGQLGGMQQAGIESQQMSILRSYVQAKQDFDEACHSLAAAHERRAMAEKKLAELNQAVMDMVQTAMQDPTIPKPNVPMNQTGYRG